MSLPNDIVPDRDEARRRQAEDPLLASAATAAEAAGLACPDAELLGLYAERALPRAEAAAIEAHVQGCARCEDVVAAIARALPAAGASAAAGAVADPGFMDRLRGWRWMVPVMSLAGAAAMAFWLGRGPAPVAEMDMARTEAGPGGGPASADALKPSYQVQQDRAKETALPVGSAAQAKRLTESSNQRRDAALADRRKAEPATAPTVVGGLAADAAKQTSAANAAIDAAAPAAPARVASAEAPAAPAPVSPAAPAVAAAPKTAATAAPAEREERARTNAFGATAQSGAAAGAGPGGGAPVGAAASGARAADLRAPFDRWRVRNGRLEFARDGKAWRRVTLPTAERVTSATERPDGTVLVITASGAQFVSANLGATWERQ